MLIIGFECFQEYSELRVGPVTVHPGMEPVTPEVEQECAQVCEQVTELGRIGYLGEGGGVTMESHEFYASS